MSFQYNKNKDWVEGISIVMQLGLTMVGSILFCLFIGRWLDKLLSISGFFTFIFTILGIFGGGNVCYRNIVLITPSSQAKRD